MSNFQVRYTITGPLFDNPGPATKNAVRHGIFMTAKDGRNAAKRNSRVDTGRLRRGWNIHVEDWNESDIYNYVPYANIWAVRDGTISREIPRLEKELIKNIGDALEKDLN